MKWLPQINISIILHRFSCLFLPRYILKIFKTLSEFQVHDTLLLMNYHAVYTISELCCILGLQIYWSFFSFFCTRVVCVWHMYICVWCMQVHMPMCVHAEAQRRILGIISCSLPWFLIQGLSMNWTLPVQMAGLQDPGIHLSPTPQCWGCLTFFMWILVIWTQGLLLYSKSCYPLSRFPAPFSSDTINSGLVDQHLICVFIIDTVGFMAMLQGYLGALMMAGFDRQCYRIENYPGDTPLSISGRVFPESNWGWQGGCSQGGLRRNQCVPELSVTADTILCCH